MSASNINDCAYSGMLAGDLDPSIKAQVRYITRTIFSRWPYRLGSSKRLVICGD